MSKHSLRSCLVPILVGSSLSLTAHAGQLLGTASNYNVFTLSNFTQQGTDSLGRVAVGGKFDPGGTISSSSLNGSGSYSVASNNPNQPPIANLVVGGDYRNGNTTINGNVVIGGTASVVGTVTGTLGVVGNLTRGYGQQGGDVLGGQDINYTGASGSLSKVTASQNLTMGGGGYFTGSVYYGGTFTNNNSYKPFSGTANFVTPAPAAPTVPINFATEASILRTLSGNLDALTSTGTATFTGNSATNTLGAITLKGTHSDQDIFHISAADLSHANSFTITGVAGETVVVNVDGSAASMSNFGFFLNGVDRQHVLLNFYNLGNTSTLSSNGVGIQGTVLAPFTAINFAGGNIDGTIIGNTIEGSGESHEFLFQGNVTFGTVAPPNATSTPEPTTLVSAGLGILMDALVAGKRRRKV